MVLQMMLVALKLLMLPQQKVNLVSKYQIQIQEKLWQKKVINRLKELNAWLEGVVTYWDNKASDAGA